MGNPNPSTPRERESAQEIAAGRKKAGEALFYLFGGTDAKGVTYDGVLHQFQLAALEADPNWKTALDGVRKDHHAKTLAVISSARNDPKFPPALVASIFSDTEKGHDPRWFAEVFLAGAAQIHAATGKALLLPPNHSSLDLIRSAYNLVDCITEDERKGLVLFMPEEAPKRTLAGTLAGILAEAEASVDEPGLTAAQRFYRYAVREWDEREEAAQRKRRERAASGGKDKVGENPVNILPPAPGQVAKPDLPAPPTTTGPALPPPPTVAAAPSTPPAPVVVQEAAPTAPTTPASATTPSNGEAERGLVLEAIAGSGIAGKAMVSMVRKGTRTYEEATAFATEKGLLG